MALNIDRLNKAVQFAIDEYVWNNTPKSEQHRLTWEQNHWAMGETTDEKVNSIDGVVTVVCATGCCLAGNMVVQAGDKFVLTGEAQPGMTAYTDYCLTKEGEVREISERATEILGIESTYIYSEGDDDDDYAEGDLFGGDNNIEDVIRLARALAAEHNQTLTIHTQALNTLRQQTAGV